MITIDSNVVIYSLDDRDPDKQAVAIDLLSRMVDQSCAIGLQVVGEVQNVLRRKLGQPPWVAAQAARNLLVSFPTYTATPTAAEAALTQMAAGRFSYWDALLLASGREAGCMTIFSEDMREGLAWNGIEIVNPFGANGLSDRAISIMAR